MKKPTPGTRSHTVKTHAPFGSWPSSITPAMVASSSPKRFDTMINDGRLFWCESIAAEKGRIGIMMHDGNECQCILPRPLSANSKVHEYGGGAYTIDKTDVYFVLADDQRIYQANFSQADYTPQALTPENNTRYSDLIIDKAHQRIIAVCEKHDDNDAHHVENYLVAVATDGSQRVTTIHQGHDFYSNPRISPCGNFLLWLTWDHPNLPWDNTQLWLAEFNESGVMSPRIIAGNGNESIFQPQWSPDGTVFFVSDRSNWWNIYRISHEQLQNDSPQAQCVFKHDAEYATPQWTFGMSTYGFLDALTILATYTQNGTWRLIKININDADNVTTQNVAADVSTIHSLYCDNNQACLIAASPTQPATAYRYTLQENALTALGEIVNPIPPEELSIPQPLRYATSNGEYSHLLFYPPQNTRYTCEDGLPPLIVICHGGPTGATESQLNVKIQYWTNRGFAVADVNYRGSTGYGREYRNALQGRWGIDDVDDMCAAVVFLGEKRLIDRNRCVIKGSSAGGYTVLAALAFRDTFRAGVSLYGIGDLECLAQDTHKFEARYLDKLIGPYPAAKDVYRARSPIHFVDNINCPLLVFQGMKDKVVPPSQAQTLYRAVKSKGLPVAYVSYPDEAHGFRQPETIAHMLDSELQFYGAIFGFTVEPSSATLSIENL